MSLTGSIALLLLLGVIAHPVFSADLSACNISSINATLSSNYTLTVTNIANTNVYTVNVTSNITESDAVLLQASSNNTAIGNWITAFTTSQNCTVGLGITYAFGVNSTTILANWTSPSFQNSTSVTFSALINNTAVYKVEYNLTIAATTNPTTATTTAKAASGGHVNQPTAMFLALIEILSLFVITSKLLS